jgi:isocitrate dehydrogenase
LSEGRTDIVKEFQGCQGGPADLGGYYLFDSEKAQAAMNPSRTLNSILDTI